MRVNYQLSRPPRGNKENRAGEIATPAREQGEKERRFERKPNKTLHYSHLGEPRGRNGPGRRLRTELVLLNFHGGQSVFKAHHTAARYQFKGALVVELGRPADGELDAAAGTQNLRGSKQHPRTRHIHRLAFPGFFSAPLV